MNKKFSNGLFYIEMCLKEIAITKLTEKIHISQRSYQFSNVGTQSHMYSKKPHLLNESMHALNR